jgi:hypothetical protein
MNLQTHYDLKMARRHLKPSEVKRIKPRLDWQPHIDPLVAAITARYAACTAARSTMRTTSARMRLSSKSFGV